VRYTSIFDLFRDFLRDEALQEKTGFCASAAGMIFRSSTPLYLQPVGLGAFRLPVERVEPGERMPNNENTGAGDASHRICPPDL
jgi:hypothetical protein